MIREIIKNMLTQTLIHIVHLGRDMELRMHNHLQNTRMKMEQIVM